MSLDFSKVLNVNFCSYTRPVPLTNSFGKVYPALHDGLLRQLMDVRPEHRVLDIGGGSAPFAGASVVTEPHLESNAHRGGRPPASGVQYVPCFAESLPFADKEFDFAIARQVFEHVNDPEAACREMMRVARRGFIETPQRNYDLLMGPNPSHQWLVSVRAGRLVFERRRFIRHPFRHIGLSLIPSSTEGQFLLHWEFKNLTNVQFAWEGQFEFEVHDDAAGFHYQNPDHAAEAHLDSALCSLLFPGSPAEHRENDAREALRYRPDWALAHNTLGLLLWRQGRAYEAQQCFRRAAQLEPNCANYAFNATLPLGAEPQIQDFTDVLPMDVAFMAAISTPVGIRMPELLLGGAALQAQASPAYQALAEVAAAAAPDAPTAQTEAEHHISRFITKADAASRQLVLELPPYWWSRPFEYEWARQFAAPDDVALDAACGICHPFKFHLADVCREVHACDLDPRILSAAEIRADIARDFGAAAASAFPDRYLRQIQYDRASLTDLPYPNAKFDKIYCISVLEHLSPADMALALAEFSRTLKDGGLVVLTVDYPSVDLESFHATARAAGLEFAGPFSFVPPADALFSEQWRLNCFRALLRRARPAQAL